MMNHADHGFITCSSRMAGRASSASPADLSGMNRASTTPASVACTPDFSTETQSSAPSTQIGREAAHAGRVQDRKSCDEKPGERQGQRREVVGVEDRDDQDGAEIVDDGERRQEHLQGERHAAAQRGQHAQRKGDVGGGRDRPAAQRHRIAPVEGDVEGGRHGHAADGAGDRQRHLRELRQRALDDLALDLQPDQQEEERHQPVVDPQHQAAC